MTRHRSKRRRRAKTTAPPVPPRAPKRSLAERIEARPKPPWHPFPLTELAVLAGIVCLGIGLFTEGATGRVLIALGLTLGALGGLDTAVREHFAGYRPHTLVLAAFPAVATAVLLAVVGAPALLVAAALPLVFGLAFAALRRIWHRTADRSAA